MVRVLALAATERQKYPISAGTLRDVGHVGLSGLSGLREPWRPKVEASRGFEELRAVNPYPSWELGPQGPVGLGKRAESRAFGEL